jgi:NADH-quinone oxidoreductase subunit M
MLWMFQRVMFGPITHPENETLKDLSLRERIVFAPLLVLILWIGVTPQPLIDRMQPALDRTLELVRVRTIACQNLVAAPVQAPGPMLSPGDPR